VHEYWNTFTAGATIAAGGVYIVCHPSADASILALCDQTHQYLSNGDDGYCLAQGTSSNPTYIDCVGDFNGDPGSGWDVCGVATATRDNTLVRKSTVVTGNMGDWSMSAGTSTADCEWIIEPQNTWTYLGSHTVSAPVTIAGFGTGTWLNPSSNQCEIQCDASRRLAETPSLALPSPEIDAALVGASSEKLVAAYLSANPELSAKMNVDELLKHLDALDQLFGQPALA